MHRMFYSDSNVKCSDTETDWIRLEIPIDLLFEDEFFPKVVAGSCAIWEKYIGEYYSDDRPIKIPGMKPINSRGLASSSDMAIASFMIEFADDICKVPYHHSSYITEESIRLHMLDLYEIDYVIFRETTHAAGSAVGRHAQGKFIPKHANADVIVIYYNKHHRNLKEMVCRAEVTNFHIEKAATLLEEYPKYLFFKSLAGTLTEKEETNHKMFSSENRTPHLNMIGSLPGEYAKVELESNIKANVTDSEFIGQPFQQKTLVINAYQAFWVRHKSYGIVKGMVDNKDLVVLNLDEILYNTLRLNIGKDITVSGRIKRHQISKQVDKPETVLYNVSVID